MHCMLHTANVFTISTEMYNEMGTMFWYKMSVTLITADEYCRTHDMYNAKLTRM